MGLIRNEEAEAVEDNPLARVLAEVEEDSALVLTATNEKLAQCIGRSIHHAHQGKADRVWSDDERSFGSTGGADASLRQAAPDRAT